MYMVVHELILIFNSEGTQPGDWGCDQCFGFRIRGSGAQKGEVAAVATLHCHSV